MGESETELMDLIDELPVKDAYAVLKTIGRTEPGVLAGAAFAVLLANALDL